MRRKDRFTKNVHSKDMAKKAFFFLAMFSFMIAYTVYPVFASGQESLQASFNALSSLIALAIQLIGGILLMWHMFEYGLSMQRQEGGATSQALKGIGGALIATIAPAIANTISGIYS